MTYQRDFEIGAGLGVFDTHVFELNGISSNREIFLANQGVNESDITDIIPLEAELSLNFADVQLAFIQEVVVEIFNRDDPIGREIFFRENVPMNTGIRLNLLPSLPDVREFVLQDEFSIRVEMRLRNITPQFLETRFDFQFFAKTE